MPPLPRRRLGQPAKPGPPPPPRQKRTQNRRAQVHYLVLTEGLNAYQISQRLGCTAHVVKADMRAMANDASFWLDMETRAGWAVQVQHMVANSFKDMERLSGLMRIIERDEQRAALAVAPEPPANPYDAKEEAAEYLEFERNLILREQAINSKRHYYGEYATLSNALARQRSLVKEFMDDLPLYRKVQQLQLWIEQHEALRPEGIEVPPPAGAPGTSAIPALTDAAQYR